MQLNRRNGAYIIFCAIVLFRCAVESSSTIECTEISKGMQIEKVTPSHAKLKSFVFEKFPFVALEMTIF